MANGTRPSGLPVEPALIYDAGERRTHAEHAAEAYDQQRRADTLDLMADHLLGDAPEAARDEYRDAAYACRGRAQWHATMATYHAIVGRP